MTKAALSISIQDQIEFIREDLDSTKVAIQDIKNSTSEDSSEEQREFFVNDLQSKVDILEAIIQNLTKLDTLTDGAGSELVINEQLADGTEVKVQRKTDSGWEFVDAEIIDYKDGKPRVRTSWGAIWSNVDPTRIHRKEVESV